MPSLALIEITRDRIRTKTSQMCGSQWCYQWRMEIPRFVAMVSVPFLAVILFLTFEVPNVFAKSVDALEGMNPLVWHVRWVWMNCIKSHEAMRLLHSCCPVSVSQFSILVFYSVKQRPGLCLINSVCKLPREARVTGSMTFKQCIHIAALGDYYILSLLTLGVRWRRQADNIIVHSVPRRNEALSHRIQSHIHTPKLFITGYN